MSEVVLIEFIGNAKSGVAAANEQVAANKEVEASAKKASESQVAASSTATKSMAANGARMSKVGKSMTKYVSLPLIGIGAVATKMSLDFSKAMLLIETHTDSSRKSVELYRKTILEMSSSGKFTQGPKELAEAMYHIASDGYKGAKALETLKESAHLATLGQSNLAETTYALVSAQKTAIRGTENLHETIGTLNGIVGAGDMKMQDLVGAMSTGILPAAKSAGLSLKDVGAALDVLTQRGVPAQQGAYRLAMTFQMMIPHTEKAIGAFKEIGLKQDDLSNRLHGPHGLLDALILLKEHLSDLSKPQQQVAIEEMFGGGRTSRGILTLIQNLGGLSDSYKSINNLAGETNKNLKAALESPVNVWAKQWAALQAALVEVGNELVPVVIPAMKEIASDVTGLAKGFEALPKGTQEWAIKLGVLGIAMGPVLRLAGGLASTLSKLSGATMAIGGSNLFAGLSQAFKGDTAMLQIMASDLMGGLSKAIPGAAAAVGIGNIISSVISGDMKDAGFEAGGALLGGIAGFFAGGPIGALIGVGVGSIGGELVSSLFGDGSAEKHISKMQKGLAESTRDAIAAMKEEKATFKNLSASSQEVVAAQTRQKVASQSVEHAEQKLAETRRKFGPLSKPAIQAELELKSAKDQDATATKRVHNAEHLHGIELKVARKSLSYIVAEEKNHVDHLDEQRAHLIQVAKAMLFSNASGKELAGEEQRLAHNTDRLTKAKADLGKTLQETAQKVNPKFAHSLESMGIAELEFGKKAKTTLQDILHPTSLLTEKTKTMGTSSSTAIGHIKGAYEKLKGVQGPFLTQSKTNLQKVSTAYEELDTTGTEGLNDLGTQTNSFLALVKASPLKFSVTSPRVKGKKKARGGPIHEGAPTGDTVPAMLERGEYVLNRKAVAKVGKSNLDQINFHQAPRFAAGGQVSEPHISGPEPLAGVPQGAIHQVFQAVQKLVKAHASKSPAGTSGPSGTSPFDGMPVAKWIIPELLWAMKHGWKGVVTSGWRDPSEVVTGTFATAPQGQSEHQFTQYPGGAVDVSEYEQFARIIAGYPGKRKLIQLGIDPLHFSGTGHKLGGIIEKLAGGGVVGTVGSILMRNGLDIESAAGILGNAYGESSWNPASVGSGGGGLWGFTASPNSLSDLQAYASAQGSSWTDAGLQTQFMLHHLSGGLKSQLNAASTTDDTTSLFMHEWERPLNYDSLGVRQGAAKKALATLKGLGGSTGAAAKEVAKQITGKYGPKAGSTGKGGGTNAPSGKYKVQTGALSFPTLPSTIAACRKELRERRAELPEYKAAIRDTKDAPTKRALEANVTAIKKRIKELLQTISKLLTERKEKGKIKAIEGRGLFPAVEDAIASRERAYNESSEYAEQVTALEPEENAAGYIAGKETSAWQQVLATEGNWRNALISGEDAVGVRERSIEAQIETLQALKATHPKAYKKNKYKLPPLRNALAALKGLYSPVTAKSLAALQAGNFVPASGEYEEGLISLQGQGKSRRLLPSLPGKAEAGSFGGLIFDTQRTIEELGLKTSTSGETDNTALLEAEKALTEQARRGQLLAELQYGPLSEFLKKMPPYIGAFAKGGPITADGMAMVHRGEYVVPANDVGKSSPTYFTLHLHGDMANAVDSAMPGMVKQVDRQMGTKYRQVVYGPGARR